MFDSALRDAPLLVTTGLGVSFATHVWLGGLFLALAGASVAFQADPERDTRERWSVFLTALVVAHAAGIVGHWVAPEFPPQLTMFAAGFLSRRMVRFAFRVVARIEARTDTIAGKIVGAVLPGAAAPADEDDRPGNPPAGQ